MRIKLTLLRTAAEPADLAVTVDGQATVADVARELALTDPLPAGLDPADLLTLRYHGVTAGGADAPVLLDPLAVASDKLRSGATVSLAHASAFDSGVGDAAPVARLRVIDGPSKGLEVLLPEGTAIIGRGRGCDVRLDDPTVSKEHARLSVSDIIEIADLRSANGLLMAGGLVQRAPLLPEDRIVLGDSTIEVERIAAARHAPLDAAQVPFNRSPRVAPVYDGEEVEAPQPPEPPKPTKFPIVMLLVPGLMAPVMFLAGRGLLGLVFMAMMPLMVIGNYVDRRLTGRREYRAAIEQFGESVSALREERQAESQRERALRLAESPAVTELLTATHQLDPLLWTRRPEHDAFLHLRLGLGTLPSRNTIKLPRRNDALPEYWNQVTALKKDFAELSGVPAVADLRTAGALGIAGPRRLMDDVARACVSQLAMLHSPAELVFTLAASAASAPRWEWLKWLPHTGSLHSPLEGPPIGANPAAVIQLVGRIEALLDARREVKVSRDQLVLPIVVLVVEDDAPIERGRLVRIAEEGPSLGIHVVWCAAAQERLPAACRTFMTVTTSSETTTAGFVTEGTAVHPLDCDTVGASEAMDLARHLAAVVDAGAPVDDASDLPDRASYLTLAGTELADGPRAILERWQENGSLVPRDGSPPRRRRTDADLRALIGQGATEPFTLDLRSQGPHALVGGTTGAGKSEFLQSWVLGMAAAHSPDRVTFLFVDYKGGSAFADCVHLPHTVGLVTDLSPHLVRRALTSLRAELQYREHLLNRKGAKDLLALERTGDPECPPSLVIIVDEFAALATEVPEFVDGVVDVAQRGRSLGLHLVLATQRPAGVIKENLRANTNLRVALRMNDEADSKDVLGLPLAASFDPAIPGRGAARTGPGRVTMFQTGYAGGRTGAAETAAQVTIETLPLGPGAPWQRPEDPEEEAAELVAEEGPTDIARIVDAIKDAARNANVPAPRKPWLPTLETVIDLSQLQPRSDSQLVLGVIDDPENQDQRTAYFRPDVDGNIVFFGASGSGKSTALRTLAIGAGITPRGGPVHVYGLDFSAGGLAALESLPHVGAIIDGADTERIQRVLALLRDTVEERAARYAEASASTIEEYREIAGQRDEPRYLLLVDGFAAFRAEWEAVMSRLPWYQTFTQLLNDGRAVGVHVAVTADRSATIPSSVAGSLQRRIVMRQVDPNAYAVLGAPKDVLDEDAPPGRAITGGGKEMQVAVLGGSSNLADQVRAIDKLAATLRRAHVAPAPAIRRLPTHIEAADMPRSVDGLPVLGVADDTLAPLGFAPLGTFLLAGPPQSGRTNALRWIAHAIKEAHPDAPLVYLGGRRSILRQWDGWRHAASGPTEAAELGTELLELLNEPPPEGEVGVVVIIEALADFLGGAAEKPVTDLIKAVKRNEHFVIGEGDTTTWGSSWPLISEIRNGRRGLALQPDQVEGDALFRTSFPRVTRKDFVVGRGLVVDKAKVRRVQIPLLP
ncbi:MAG TPA: FtsK/SpoIIIE domain-containing protein [Actinomycetaceae bacterium]|nr:FtsK/SpoIIIE domain-containing protein [Actinomycetaceae bacterium]